MDKELARYIRGVAVRHSASEMLEDDLFLSSLLTDLVLGVQPRVHDDGFESLGMARLSELHDSAVVGNDRS